MSISRPGQPARVTRSLLGAGIPGALAVAAGLAVGVSVGLVVGASVGLVVAVAVGLDSGASVGLVVGVGVAVALIAGAGDAGGVGVDLVDPQTGQTDFRYIQKPFRRADIRDVRYEVLAPAPATRSSS